MWPNKANANDVCPLSCDVLYSVVFGALTVLASAIIIPLAGLGLVESENPPYWGAVGYTFVALSVGVWIFFKQYDSRDENIREFVEFPLLFGAVATALSYSFLLRRTDKTLSSLWQYAPQISVSPVVRGGSIWLKWSF